MQLASFDLNKLNHKILNWKETEVDADYANADPIQLKLLEIMHQNNRIIIRNFKIECA